MSLAFFSDLSQNLLMRTLAATAAVFLFLGLATGALPVKCLTQGLTSCGAVPSVSPDVPAKAPLRFAPLPAKPVTVAAADTSAPTLSYNAVVSDSFALLRLDPQPTVAALGGTWKSTAASDDRALASRTVKTVAIRANGAPDTASTSVAETTSVALASPTGLPPVAPLIAPANDDGAAAAIEAVAPVPVSSRPAQVDKLALVAEAPHKPKKVAANTKYASVSGQGANVHSSGKSSSGVVFALTGGSKVTIGETSHGWVHITDAKGRSGWMYKDYLS
jgi:SH3 domain-containing protein